RRFSTPERPLQTAVVGPLLFTTDMPLDQVQVFGSELLTLEQQIATELKLPRVSIPIRLYIFQDRARYLGFLQQHFPSLKQSGEKRRAMFLLRNGTPHIFAYRGGDLLRDLRHEFTHALLNTSVTGLPIWLDEGLAVFFETPNGTGAQPAHVVFLSSQLR